MNKRLVIFISCLVVLIAGIIGITSAINNSGNNVNGEIIGGPDYNYKIIGNDDEFPVVYGGEMRMPISYKTIMSYQTSGIDFKLANVFNGGLMLLSSYMGPTRSTTIIIEIDRNVTLQMSCGSDEVLRYVFDVDNYTRYAISIRKDRFLGKCSYGEDVLVKLISDGKVKFEETYKYEIDDKVYGSNKDNVVETIDYESDDYTFVDVFLSQYTTGYFSLDGLNVYTDKVHYKVELQNVGLSFNRRTYRSIDIDYKDIEDEIMDIFEDIEGSYVCGSSRNVTWYTDICETKYDMTVHFLFEFDISNDEYPHTKLNVGFGEYEGYDGASMYVYGVNEHGSYSFLVTSDDNPKISEFYDYLYELYEQDSSE